MVISCEDPLDSSTIMDVVPPVRNGLGKCRKGNQWWIGDDNGMNILGTFGGIGRFIHADIEGFITFAGAIINLGDIDRHCFRAGGDCHRAAGNRLIYTLLGHPRQGKRHSHIIN